MIWIIVVAVLCSAVAVFISVENVARWRRKALESSFIRGTIIARQAVDATGGRNAVVISRAAAAALEENSVMSTNRMGNYSSSVPSAPSPSAHIYPRPSFHSQLMTMTHNHGSNASENSNTGATHRETLVTTIARGDGTVTTIARTRTLRRTDTVPSIGITDSAAAVATTTMFDGSIRRSNRCEQIEESLEFRIAIPLSVQCDQHALDSVAPQEMEFNMNVIANIRGDQKHNIMNSIATNDITIRRNDISDVVDGNLNNGTMMMDGVDDDDDKSDKSPSRISANESCRLESSGGGSWFFANHTDTTLPITYVESGKQECCSICLEPYAVGDVVARMRPRMQCDHKAAIFPVRSGEDRINHATTDYRRNIPMGDDKGDDSDHRCNHWFHKQCILDWLQDHNDCPLCRVKMIHKENNRCARTAAADILSNTY